MKFDNILAMNLSTICILSI